MPTTLKGGGAIVAPTMTGYTFAGFFDATSGGTKYYNANLTSAHVWDKASTGVTLYAQWTANTYTITLTAGAGTTSAGTTSIGATYNASTNLTSSITTPTKDKNVFDGYYTGTNGSGTQIIDAFGNIIANAGGGSTYTDAEKKWKYAGNIELYANWIPKYPFEITGDNYTINNEAWNKTGAFTFVHADEDHMTTTIQNPDVISYDRASNTITALKIGTSKITFTQNTSTTVENGTLEWTITVDSVANNLAVSGTSFTKYVDEEIASIRSNQNSNGTITTTSSNPNLAHYDITNNKIVIPNSDAQNLPFDDVIITISQAATAKYKAKKHTITLTVKKYANSLKCAWDGGAAGDVWSKDVNFDSETGVTFSSNNDAVAPIVVTQIAGAAIATYDSEGDEIVANFREGMATWTVSQAEDYKYQSATTQTLTVNVGTIESNCNVVDNHNTEYDIYASGGLHKYTIDGETVYGYRGDGDPVFSLSGPGDKLYFRAKKSGGNHLRVLYSTDNCNTLKLLREFSVADSYTLYNCDIPTGTTDICFFVKYGETYTKYYRDIYVTRKTYLDVENEEGTAITSITMPSKTASGAATTATFYVDYSTCDDVIKVVSDHPHITVSDASFPSTTAARKAITLTYNSSETEEISATITIYTQYEHETLTVNAETLGKLSTTLEYIGSDSYSVNADNVAATSLFQVRDQNGDLVASPVITLSSSNTDAINTVSSNTALDFLCGGSATITASYAGDETYAAADDLGQAITVNKLNDVVTWKVGQDQDYKIHVWADSPMPSLAQVNSTSGVTYTSGGDTYLTVTDGVLHSHAHGEVALTVHSDGDCHYNTVDSVKTIVVDPCTHEIVWDQSFVGLSTDGDGTINERILLNAYAVDSSSVATDVAITYTISSGSFARIENTNELVLTGEGKTTITATTAADDKYAVVSEEKVIRVRVYGTGCGTEVTDVTGGGEKHKLSGYTNKKGFTYNIGPSEEMTLKIGRESSITCGKLYIHGYSEANAGGSQTEIAVYDPSDLSNDGSDYAIALDRSYRSIKIQAIGRTGLDPVPSGGTQYKWYSDLHIKQASYIESSVPEIRNTGVHVFEEFETTFTISYSDKPVIQYNYSGDYLTLTPDREVNNDCGDYGTYTFTLRGTFPRVGLFEENITFTTTAGDRLVIPVHLEVNTKGTFNFNVRAGEWSESTDWSYGGSTTHNMTPGPANSVCVSQPLTVTGQVEAYDITILSGGSITIAPNGGISVGRGGITGATASNLILKAGTEGETKGQTGYLRISPHYTDTMPHAKVQMYSIGYYDVNRTEEDIASWQYVGTPIDFAGKLAKTVFTRSWIYSYVESSDTWVNNRKTLVMQPFVGYETTQYDSEDGKMIEYPGQLVPNRGLVTIDLEYTDADHGHNLLANSFAAPIDITQLRDTDFVNAERTIYLFNTGSKSQADGYSKSSSGDAAGQFRTIAIGSAAEMAERFAEDASLPTTIAPMQGFCVNAQNTGAKLKLNYNKLVWNADYTSHAPTALRAPKHNAETAEEEEMPITGSMKMTLEANGRADNIYLLESERYMTDFEDGYDAHKMESGTLNIFTVENEDKLAIDATNSIIGTRVGVRTGEETAYTITFSYVDGEQEWALYDAETDEMIDITNDNTYTFFAEPNSNITERFMIVESNGAQIPAVTTGNDKVTSDVRAHKFIKDGELFILKNGVLYDVTGARVK